MFLQKSLLNTCSDFRKTFLCLSIFFKSCVGSVNSDYIFLVFLLKFEKCSHLENTFFKIMFASALPLAARAIVKQESLCSQLARVVRKSQEVPGSIPTSSSSFSLFCIFYCVYINQYLHTYTPALSSTNAALHFDVALFPNSFHRDEEGQIITARVGRQERVVDAFGAEICAMAAAIATCTELGGHPSGV